MEWFLYYSIVSINIIIFTVTVMIVAIIIVIDIIVVITITILTTKNIIIYFLKLSDFIDFALEFTKFI